LKIGPLASPLGGKSLQELRGNCIIFLYKIKIFCILALVDSLNSDEITGRFALSSSELQKHLNVLKQGSGREGKVGEREGDLLQGLEGGRRPWAYIVDQCT